MRLFSTRSWTVAGLLTLLIILAPGTPRAAAQTTQPDGKELTIERIFGQPGLSGRPTPGLEWSPDGKTVSYFHVEMDQGKPTRELWGMDAASGQIRVLVSKDKLESLIEPPKGKPSQATGLGRRTPAGYLWAPDSKAMLFISDDQLIWLDLQTMTSRVLVHSDTSVEDPKISPDGRFVSYVENYNLWDIPAAGGKAKPLTEGGNADLLKGKLDWVYPEELNIATAYWWAPDSKRIAYLQMDESKVNHYPLVDLTSYTGVTDFERYPNAGDANPIVHVGVVSADGGATKWMDTGADDEIYLARVQWLPDSKSVAIERLNRAQNRLDLLTADASNGKSGILVTQEDPYWVNVTDDLTFFKNSPRFLWTGEQSGFRHLYLYNMRGQALAQLTQGAWMVTDVNGVDEKNGYVYFTGTKKSPLESQIYRVPLTGGEPQRLTKEDGSHFAVMAPDASGWVGLYTNVMLPVRADLYRADGRYVAAINENKIPELADYDLSPVKFLTVNADDGTKLYAYMIKPRNFDPAKKYPVIISVYGGPDVHSVMDAWGGSIFLWHQMMAQKGYIIFELDNRGANNRGHAFEAAIYHHLGKVQLEDQLAGVKYLKSLPYVDGARIGIWGWSFGGYMTLTAMFNAPDTFKVGFAGGPVTDWRQYDSIYTERYMGKPQDNPEGYKDSSPVSHVAGLKGKVLIAQGTGDDNVHFSNTVELVDRLIDVDKYIEVMMYPGRGHGVSDAPARIQLWQRVTDLFVNNL